MNPPKLFAGHSVTLGGDIGVNFFIDSNVAGVATAQTATVKFAWDGGKYIKEVNLKEMTPDNNGMYKVTINVVAAQMAHTIEAVAYINGNMFYTADVFSVQEYAEKVFANPGEYDTEGKPNEFKALAKALLNYGSEAQTVFADALKAHPDRADTNVGQTDYSGVTADLVQSKINGSASDLNEIAAQLDAEFYTSSLLYLQNNTLRLYFTPASKTVGGLEGKGFDGALSEYYYYADHADIAAAELDDQQEFTVGNVSFTYSPLDYVAAVIGSANMIDAQKNLAKALFLYNQAANAYFDAAPAPAQKILVLDDVTEDTIVEDGYTITGTLQGDYKISIADGATVTLKDVNITCLSYNARCAGITPLGDATILLEGENTVKGGFGYAGVYSAEGATLTIDGKGSLDATGGEFAAGIGSGNSNSCGNITITGGTITAFGKSNAPGIGGGYFGKCQSITITGGTITANGGGVYAAGIGSGYGADSTCGNIMIANTVTKVTATKGSDAPNSIGAGKYASCGTVTIGGVEGAITDSPYTYEP